MSIHRRDRFLRPNGHCSPSTAYTASVIVPIPPLLPQAGIIVLALLAILRGSDEHRRDY